MIEAKENLEQSVSRQQRSVWAAGVGDMSVLRSSREENEQRRLIRDRISGPATLMGPVKEEPLDEEIVHGA